MGLKSCVMLATLTYAFGFPSRLFADEFIIATQALFFAKPCEAITRRVFEDMGHQVKFRILPTARSIYLSNKGETDGEIGRIAGLSEAFPNLIQTHPSYIPMQINAFSSVKNMEFSTWASLAPYRIGIHRGHRYANNGTKGFAKVSELTDDTQLIKMIANDRIEVAPLIAIDGMETLRRTKLSGISMTQTPLEIFPLYLYIHKKNEKLIPKIEISLRKIVESGEALRIANDIIKELGIRLDENGRIVKLNP